ncbi:MAG: nucleotidyltransferase domain-containing protein [Bacteroidetes bacterium]|nr:nucleotidyltransferase domain-containing protein [Bacteroidota bacterium]
MINSNVNELRKICVNHNVSSLCLFGSAAKGNFKSDSDLDFLVRFNDKINLLDYADNFFSMIEELEKLFNRKVDLLTVSSLKNPILKKEIENTQIALYAA